MKRRSGASVALIDLRPSLAIAAPTACADGLAPLGRALAGVLGVVLAHTGQHPVSRAAARTVVVANVGLEVRGATTEATRVARVRRIGAHGPVAPCSGSGSSTVESATTISSWSARS